MKKIIFLIFIVFAVLGLAEEKIRFLPTTNLQEISTQTNIPVKKIAQYLKLEDQTKFNLSIQELSISNEDINNAIVEYNTNKKSFYTGISLVGMGIVFASLMLVGFIISLLQHIGDPNKKTKVKELNSIL